MSGKGVELFSHDKILDWSKLKAYTDNNLNVGKML